MSEKLEKLIKQYENSIKQINEDETDNQGLDELEELERDIYKQFLKELQMLEQERKG